MTNETSTPDIAYAVTLAGLDDMTPVRLSKLLAGRPAEQVYRQLLGGDPDLVDRLVEIPGFSRQAAGAERDPGQLPTESAFGQAEPPKDEVDRRGAAHMTLKRWAECARVVPVTQRLESLQSAGIQAVRRGDPGYPQRLERAQTAPEVLYYKGSLTHANGPCVGIVGSRKATPYGMEVANEFGAALAARGVVVVSGLASGIDAAAHWGTVKAVGGQAGPIGVVGGGVDRIYPTQNAKLWGEVERLGGVMSDAPPGAPPEGWRFPLRNRLIAALSQVVVVVESSRKGGAMHTVQAADAIGVQVMAVPGSVRSLQSEGTNAVLQAGADVCLDVTDIFTGLSRACAADGTAMSLAALQQASGGADEEGKTRAEAMMLARERLLHDLGVEGKKVFEAVNEGGSSVETICRLSGLDLGATALCLDKLDDLGLVQAVGPNWCRR